MQMLSTSLGTHVLEWLNVPVFQDGNIIDLGGYKLQVVEACNGLRYLFPLLSISYLFAYLYKASALKRGMVFLSAIPIAVLMNGLRIAMIGVTVDRWGAQMAEGLLHEVEGGVVFLGCILCLMLEVRLLQCVGRKGTLDWNLIRLPSCARITPPALGMPVYAALSTVLIALALGYSVPALRGQGLHDVKLRQPFSAFPLQLGPWVGHFDPFDPAALTKLGGTDYLLADYARPGAPPVNLYALYYAHQDALSNEAIHSPSICIPAGGWAVTSSSVVAVALKDGTQLWVNRVLVSKEGVRQVVYYWFDQDGHPVWSPNMAKFWQMKNAMTKGVTNGAMLRYVTVIAPQETQAAAEARLADFMNASVGKLDGFMFGSSK
jgi:exosortase D (VPLPA-CTERM-specific)